MISIQSYNTYIKKINSPDAYAPKESSASGRERGVEPTLLVGEAKEGDWDPISRPPRHRLLQRGVHEDHLVRVAPPNVVRVQRRGAVLHGELAPATVLVRYAADEDVNHLLAHLRPRIPAPPRLHPCSRQLRGR